MVTRVRRLCQTRDGHLAREVAVAHSMRAIPMVRSRSAPSVNSQPLTQLVQASVAGLVVAVAAPPVAATPVSEGSEK